ncbi:MAG: hypothetical protein CMI53_04030 [Parcubacteria group bacterium]|nr:hypothetical protein [Parcubacteria group bacterium]|tara:strand:+ start:1793 stop:2158 length:366 start_codon:yes stop_codon:yes gene_type:complete
MSKYKKIAILGIVSYILTVALSGQDLEGNLLAPIWLIAISGIIRLIFYFLSVSVLWKVAKRDVSIFLIIIILSVGVQQFYQSENSLINILINITKIVEFLFYFYIVFLLFSFNKQLKTEVK